MKRRELLKIRMDFVKGMILNPTAEEAYREIIRYAMIVRAIKRTGQRNRLKENTAVKYGINNNR